MVKKLRYFCTLLLMMVASVTWAGSEKITFSDLNLDNAWDMTTQTWGTGFTLTFNNGTNSNTPKYYTTGAAVRCYGGNYFTITSENTLTKIELTFSSGGGSNEITTDKVTYANGVWEGSETEVKFTIGGTSGHRRIASIEVTWEEGDDSKQDAQFSFGETDTFEVDQNSDGTFPAFTAPTLTYAQGFDGTVVYSSTNEEVAEVNSENGTVTIVGVGETYIKATSEATNLFNAGLASYKITVNKYIDPNAPGMSKENPYTVAQARAAIDAGEGVENVYATGIVSEIVTAYSSQFGNITYNISTDGTTTADQLQSYRGKSYNGDNFTSADDIQVGDEVVIYGNLTKYGSTYEFAANNQLVSLKRTDVPVKVDVATVNTLTPTSLTVGDEGTFVADVTVADGVADDEYEVTFATSDDNILGVDAKTGEYQAYAKGTVTVTVHVEALDAEHFNNVDKEFTVVVKNAAAPAATGDYKLVTSTADIEDGQYLIVYEQTALDGSLGTGIDKTQNYIGVAMSGDFIVANEGANTASFNVTAVDGGYAITTQDGTYIGHTGTKNTLNAQNTELVNTLSINEENGEAVIACGEYYLRFNKASDQDRFRYYKSGQQAVYLYKRVNETAPAVTFNVNVTEAGYATLYYGASNLVVPEGVQASTYTVTEGQLQASKVYTANEVIPAGTGVVLEAAEGTYTFAATSEVAEGDDANMLKGSDGGYQDKTEGFKYYILSYDKQGQNPGFYFQYEDGTKVDNGAHKAYLAVPAEMAGEAKFFTFGGETGINAVEAGKTNGVVYNLQGQRVENAQKGIFIMNGKKVVR